MLLRITATNQSARSTMLYWHQYRSTEVWYSSEWRMQSFQQIPPLTYVVLDVCAWGPSIRRVRTSE